MIVHSKQKDAPMLTTAPNYLLTKNPELSMPSIRFLLDTLRRFVSNVPTHMDL